MNPKLFEICVCNWTLNWLGYHIWAHPVIEICTYCADPDNFCRDDNTEGFGRIWFPTFPIPSSPNYPSVLWCISEIWIQFLPWMQGAHIQTRSAKKRDKKNIYWGLYRIHIFVFLTPLRISLARLEILFFVNHHVILCIFNYCTSSRVNSRLEI